MVNVLNQNTTLGKTLKTLLWVGLSAAVTAIVANVTERPELFNPYVVGAANLVAVFLKNLVDPKVSNI